MWIDEHGAEVLPVPESLRLLATEAVHGGVGRLAVAGRRSPDLVPVNFSFTDRQILVYLAEGPLWREMRNHLVTFEVDHVDPASSRAWSVVVRGLATDAQPEDVDPDRLPRPMVPEPGSRLLAVRPDVVTGRRFTLGADRPRRAG